MAWIVTFICISGLGTPITTHLMAIDGFLGLSGWRWVFILTGVPAVVMAFVIYKVLRDKPSEAEFLSEEERGWLTDTLGVRRRKSAKRSSVSTASSRDSCTHEYWC